MSRKVSPRYLEIHTQDTPTKQSKEKQMKESISHLTLIHIMRKYLPSYVQWTRYYTRYIRWKYPTIFSLSSCAKVVIGNLLGTKEKLNYKELKVKYSTINWENSILPTLGRKSIQMQITFVIHMEHHTKIEKNCPFVKFKWFLYIYMIVCVTIILNKEFGLVIQVYPSTTISLWSSSNCTHNKWFWKFKCSGFCETWWFIWNY